MLHPSNTANHAVAARPIGHPSPDRTAEIAPDSRNGRRAGCGLGGSDCGEAHRVRERQNTGRSDLDRCRCERIDQAADLALQERLRERSVSERVRQTFDLVVYSAADAGERTVVSEPSLLKLVCVR